MEVANSLYTHWGLVQALAFAYFVMFVVGVSATVCAFVYSLAIELVAKRRAAVAYRRYFLGIIPPDVRD